MSDYITELRRDLVGAAERERGRGRAGRVARPLRPRAWSPAAVAGALAMAALLVAVVLTLTRLAPPPKPSDAKVVATVHLGGQPRDAVLAGGSVWIADYEGRVLRLDPATRRVRARIGVGGTPVSITADRDSVWLMSIDDNRGGGLRSHLYELDARTGRILDRVAVLGWGGTVAAGGGGLWLLPDTHGADLERIDPGGSHRRTAFIPGVAYEGLAVTERSVWTRREDSVFEIDSTTGRVLNRVRGIASAFVSTSQRTLVPDPDGAWVVGSSDGLVLRVEGGRVVRRIAVGATAGVLARIGADLWVSASPGVDKFELVHVDSDGGKVTQRIGFGFDVPQTLVPVGKDLWVITSGGQAMLVSPG